MGVIGQVGRPIWAGKPVRFAVNFKNLTAAGVPADPDPTCGGVLVLLAWAPGLICLPVSGSMMASPENTNSTTSNSHQQQQSNNFYNPNISQFKTEML